MQVEYLKKHHHGAQTFDQNLHSVVGAHLELPGCCFWYLSLDL